MARKTRGKRPFLYLMPEDFDPLRKEYEVVEVASQKWLGAVRGEGVNNWEVKRPRDNGFHYAFGNRREAALWLRDHQDDPAIFDEKAGG